MIKVLADSVLGEGCLTNLQMVIFLLYPHMTDSREKRISLVSLLMRALIHREVV